MNHYEEKKEARIQRLRERAEKTKEKGQAMVDSGFDRLRSIPFGQPILIGHHSEKRDRNFRDKANNSIRRGFEEIDKANHYENKAKAAENNTAIFTDDPEAIQKLKVKIDELENQSKTMKDTNAAYRWYVNKGDPAKLTALGISDPEALRKKVEAGYSWEKAPFARFQLSNLRQNITRYKKRLELLEKRAARAEVNPKKTTVIGGVKFIENLEENRLQIFFPGIPSPEIRQKMKRSGFRWSRYNGCWQRHLSNGTVWAAREIIKEIEQ